MQNRQKVLVIVGPTASGKSALAVVLARKFGGEIVSADSRQVYGGLDIGTGKITKREMKGVSHHLLDVASPKKTFTAYDFATKGRAAMGSIAARHSLPIVVGGTGFYIDALLSEAMLPNVPPNPKLRARLEKKSAQELFAMLKRKDPARAKTIEPHHKRRLIRALEIAAAKSKLSSQHIKETPRYSCDALWIGIAPSQKELERKIRARLSARIRQGMIAEGRNLHAAGLSYARMENLGLEYRALARLLQGKTTRDEFEQELFRDIRRYAKKQLAYWKRNRKIVWYDPKQRKKIERAVAKRLGKQH